MQQGAVAANLLDLEQLTAALPRLNIAYFLQLDSTNQYLLERVDSLPSGALCLAEQQLAGRGRRGKRWHSPFGANLYLSQYWFYQGKMADISALALVVGMAVVDALIELGAADIKLKWPNDIYWQHKKLGGILIESICNKQGMHLVIGLGLNLAMPADNAIDQPWVNLADLIATLPPKAQLVAALVRHTQAKIRQLETQGFAAFIDDWHSYDAFYQQRVQVLSAQDTITGIASGVTEDGALLVATAAGMMRYYGNDVSLRLDHASVNCP